MSDNKDILLINGYSGIGDRICDIIGSYIIAKYLGYKLNIIFNPVNGSKQEWGINNIFDIRLFDFDNENIKVINNENDINCKYNYFIRLLQHGCSTSPYFIYKFLKKFNKNITFEEIIDNYNNYAKEIIKPSKIIEDNIPENLNNCYGIHLRKTDKIYNSNVYSGSSNTINEFNIICNALFDDIYNIILTEIEPLFLITSEDNEWKEYLKNKLLTFAKINNKIINFINVNYYNSNTYDNYNAILDFFCLSKCKKIFQGTKYSTFSISAAIIGNTEIINYAHKLECYNNWLMHIYNPVIKINNKKESNINFITQILINNEPNIYTNIIQNI
jgi:hypothetical protein